MAGLVKKDDVPDLEPASVRWGEAVDPTLGYFDGLVLPKAWVGLLGFLPI